MASSTVADIPAAISAVCISLHSLLPESLQLYIARVSANLPSTPQILPKSQAFDFIQKLPLTSPEVITTTFLALFVALVTMNGWGRRFGGWAGRYSPAAAASGPPPQVSDSDFSYLTADDIVDPPRRVYDPYNSNTPRRGNVTRPHDPNLGPDILLVKHRGVTYPLHFPPFDISDGYLLIGDLRNETARQTGTDDPRRIKLLYKGRKLNDDSKPCRAEGLKQQSELMAVISEADPSGAPDESSESGPDSLNGPTVEVDGTISAPAKKKRSHRAKPKPKKGDSGTASPRTNENLAPPDTASPATSTSRPSTPAPPKTAMEKLDELASTFHTQLVPKCVQFMNNVPQNAKTRDLEYKKLSETILSQVILKLDAVETEGDGEARQKRRDLVKETQAMLSKLDSVHARNS